MADNENLTEWNYIKGIFWSIFTIIWFIAMLIAIYMSVVCLSYNGTTGSKVGGVLLALFFGPFYWLYYIFRSTYCTKDYYYPQ